MTMKPDDGIDAPGGVRSLLLVAAAGLTAWLTTAFGLAIIDDIRHGPDYASAFAAKSCTAVRVESKRDSFVALVGTMGSLPPAKLVARKATA
jgi:hypothetical protein